MTRAAAQTCLPARKPHRRSHRDPDAFRTPLRIEPDPSAADGIRTAHCPLDWRAADTLERGQFLARYRIQEKLGSGGMAPVYSAWDTWLYRRVALKVLSRTADRLLLSRFEQEARALAALSHPHVVTVLDFFETRDYSVTVMEVVDGATLREHLGDGTLDLEKTLCYGGQIARGLACAHDKRIIHRDIKPENILISSSGQAKLADFGLSKGLPRVAEKGNDTDAGLIVGTVDYMSPEQMRGEELDCRSDIFAFGVVLFEMAFGEHPFPGATRADTIVSILKNPPLPVPIPELAYRPLLEINYRCLRKNRFERFDSARQVASALSACERDARHSC